MRIDVQGSGLPWTVLPPAGGLGLSKKAGEQATGSKPVSSAPPWPPHQCLAPLEDEL